MSFIDNIRKSINSDYIIGAFHKKGAECYFDDLRRPSGARIKGFRGVTIQTKARTSETNLEEDEFYEFSYQLESLSDTEPCCQFVSVGDVRAVDKNKLLKVRLDEKMQLQGTNLDDANQNQAMINQEVTGAPHTYIYELLQNSNDYPCLDSNEVEIPVEVKFIVTAHYLFFIHSGAPFSLRNIAAICTVNEGEKRNNTKTIGYKGMGFKSVFVNNDYVYLNSGGWSLRFDEKEINKPGAEERNWQYMPIATEETELDSEVLNVLRNTPKEMNVFFALRHQSDAKENIPNLDTVFKDDRILVFIPYVDHVEVFVGDELRFDRYKDRQRWLIKDDLKIDVDDTYKRILEKSLKTDKKIPEKFQQIKEISLAFAVQREGNKLLPVEDAKVYNYLPTEKSLYLPFMLNADFVPDASRKDLPDHPWNLKVLEDAGHKYAQWWATLFNEGYDYETIFDILPDFRTTDKFRESFMKGFEEELGIIECIPVQIGSAVKLVPFKEIIFDEIGLISSSEPVMTDRDFYELTGFSNRSIFLPHPEVRLHSRLKEYLLYFKKKNNIGYTLTQDNVIDITLSPAFKNWMIEENHACDFYSFLFKKNYMNHVLAKNDVIFLTENHQIVSRKEIYLNVDKELEELYMFEDLIPRMNREVRDSLNSHFNSIAGTFMPFSAPALASKIADAFDRNGYSSRIKSFEESRKFLNFLASAKDGIYRYTGNIPTTMPVYLKDSSSQQGISNLYIETSLGNSLQDQSWVNKEWIRFINEGYIDWSEDLNYFLKRNGVEEISQSTIWNDFVANDERNEYIISKIEDKDTNIEFYDFLLKIEEVVKFSDPTKQLKTKYHIWVNDSVNEEYVPLSMQLYWEDDNWRNFLKESWLPEQCCWVVDEDYLSAYVGEERDAVRKFFTSKFIANKFSISDFFNKCLNGCWTEIVQRIDSKELSFDFLQFLFIHRTEITGSFKSEKYNEIPLFFEGEITGKSINDLGHDVTVFQPSKEIDLLCDEPWFEDTSITVLDDIYLPLFESKDGREFFDKVGIKIFDLMSFLKDNVIEDLKDYKDVLSSKENNLSFHRYFSKVYSKLTKEDMDSLKQAPIFVSSSEIAEGTLCDASGNHYLPSDLLTDIINEDIVPIELLDSVHPDYCQSDNDSEYLLSLGNCELSEDNFLGYINDQSNHESVKNYIKSDDNRNIRFWRWIVDFTADESELRKLKGLPMLTSDDDFELDYTRMYVAEGFTNTHDTSELISDFVQNPVFVSKRYLEADNARNWRHLFVALGINLTAKYIVLNRLVPYLDNYRSIKVVSYLAPYVKEIEQWINDNDEVRLKQLENLHLLCEDGKYHKVKETLVSGSYVDLSSSVYPDITVDNFVKDSYLTDCKDDNRLKEHVKRLIVEISRRFGKLRSDARVYRNTKIRFFIENQNKFAASEAHYRIIASLSDDYQKDGEDDDFKKLFEGKSISLYTTTGDLLNSRELYLSSEYGPLCDFMLYGVNNLSFVSEEYAKYGDIKNLRKFFIWQLGVRNDFSERTIGCLENENFSRYFWTDFLVAANNDQYSLPYESILTAQTLYNVRCIPTKWGNKRPGFLYDSRIDELCKMVAAIGKKDSNLPDVTIPKGYLIGLKGSLTFEDCLLYLKKENPAYREIVYKTMVKLATEHPERLEAWTKQGYVTRFRDEARWYNGKSWVPIKNLVALQWAENHSILKDNFGFSELVISKMPSGKDDYNKLCEILQIRILTNDDFDHTYDDKSEVDHLSIEEITKRLLYLSYRHNPETWEEEFEKIQKDLADTDIRICNSISYFWTENDALSADLLTYTEELDTLWYVGNWNGAAFVDIIEWLVKKFPFLKAFDFNVIKTCFYKDFKVLLKEIDKLPTNFLNYLSEEDRDGLSVDDYDETQINTDVEQLPSNNSEGSSNEDDSESGLYEKDHEKDSNPYGYTDRSKTGESHNDHREGSNGPNHHVENDRVSSNNGKSENEIDEDDSGDFKKQSYERWERDAKKQPVAPTSDQPLVKEEGTSFDPEETPKTDPEYGDAYDASVKSRNDYDNTRNSRSNTGNQELRKAKEQERTAREKLSRREMLNRVPKYTLEWFNYRLDVCLEDQKSYTAREIALDFHDWCKIDPAQNLYRLISPDGYIPLSFADYNNQKVSVITNGKRYLVDARVIEADETGVDLICATDLGNPIEGRRIQIQATSTGGFTDHLVSRFRKLQNSYQMATNLKTMLPDNISFIYGPPGTGKTYQLVKTISDLVRTNYKINILVLTPTNRAADEIAERLCTDTFAGEYTSRYGVTESRILAEEHYACLKNRHNMDVSLNKNVIITTIARYPYDTVRKGQISENIFDLKWDYIIVDEASMIDVIDITLLLLNNKAEQFIIAGDPNQIRPITPHDIEECNIYDMVNLSSFKLAKENTFKYPVTALDMQYRSVPQIGGMVSRFCYDGLLKTNPQRDKQKPLKLSGLNIETANAIGFNVELLSYLYGWNKVDNSPVHVYSAIFAYEFAAYIAREISKNHPTFDYTIGIVTPYGKQKEAIKQLLEQKDISTLNCTVKCGTAHSFQGGECDIMIVVMNYPDIYAGSSTHINNKNIMNVAMSRARDYLFFLWPEVKPEHKSKSNVDKLPYIMNQQIGRLLPPGFNQLHAFDIEEIIFGDKTFIAKNSGSRCHMPVNVSVASDKRYEIRLSDSALDIQIND